MSYSGRDITEENVSKVFEGLGMVPDLRILSRLFKASIRSHIPYITAYYTLVALGKVPSEPEILKLVKILGIEPDSTRIKDVTSFLSAV